MTYLEQLQKWVNGESMHDPDEDRCCPDFSCCQPELLARKTDRMLFLRAFLFKNEPVMNELLMGFLRAAIHHAAPDREVHIITNNPPEDN